MKVTALESAIMRLISSDRFYAEVVLQLARVPSTKCPTAGVSVVPRPTLTYHPEIFEINDAQTGQDILKHEVLHMILNHLGRSGNRMTKIQNVAADLAVNSFIPSLQKIRIPGNGGQMGQAITVENIKSQYPDIIPGQTME